MKNISKFIFGLLIIALALPALQSCKKGDNDPAISLKSRKARLVGEWDMTKGSVVYTSGGTVQTQTYNEGTFTQTSGGTSVTGVYTLDVSILKDGKVTFKLTITVSGNTTTDSYEGYWYFLDANKALDAKNKERVALQWTKRTYTSGGTTNVYSYSGGDPDEYYLDELKGKEMIWKRSVSATGGSTSSMDIEYLFTLK
jgi:hypothetical protein